MKQSEASLSFVSGNSNYLDNNNSVIIRYRQTGDMRCDVHKCLQKVCTKDQEVQKKTSVDIILTERMSDANFMMITDYGGYGYFGFL